jgi:hypothetical protein
MKILGVTVNNRRRCFQVRTKTEEYTFPFVRCTPEPSPADPLTAVYVDPEVGGDGITYTLKSGGEGTVLLDQILDYHRDPKYMKKLVLHSLTTEALRAVHASRLSKREIIRLLGTSPAQLYRLLDPANYEKSVDEMLRLLWTLGQFVEINVLDRTA